MKEPEVTMLSAQLSTHRSQTQMDIQRGIHRLTLTSLSNTH